MPVKTLINYLCLFLLCLLFCACGGKGKLEDLTADAGADSVVYSMEQVVLDGSRSKGRAGGAEDLTYSWAQLAGPQVELVNADSISAHFYAPTVGVGEALSFQLTVTEDGETSIDTVEVRVQVCEDSGDTIFANCLNTYWGAFTSYSYNFDEAAGGLSVLGKEESQSVNWELVNLSGSHGKVLQAQWNVNDPSDQINDAAWLGLLSEPHLDLSDYAEGAVSFDIRILQAGDYEDLWQLSMECEWPCSSGLAWVETAEVGQWQRLSFSMKHFAESGLDLRNVRHPFLLRPGWGYQKGQYLIQLDNIQLERSYTPANPYPAPQEKPSDLVFYESGFGEYQLVDRHIMEVDAGVYEDLYAFEEVVDEFQYLRISSASDWEIQFPIRLRAPAFLDFTDYAHGAIQFDLYVEDYGASTGEFVVNLGCGGSCEALQGFNIGRPDIGFWQQYEVPIGFLVERGVRLERLRDSLRLSMSEGISTGLVFGLNNFRWVADIGKEPSGNVVEAGEDQSLNASGFVRLDGSNSDGFGSSSALSYQWLQTAGPAVEFLEADGASLVSPTFIAPDVEALTTLTFRLTVSDGEQSAFDEVSIEVTPCAFASGVIYGDCLSPGYGAIAAYIEEAEGGLMFYDGTANRHVQWEEVTDAERGTILRAYWNNNDVLEEMDEKGWFGISGGEIDVSEYRGGALEFDMRIVSLGETTNVLEFNMECVWPCRSQEFHLMDQLELNVWKTHSISIDLAEESGLDLTHVNNVFMIKPMWIHQQGPVILEFDNIRWLENYNPPALDYAPAGQFEQYWIFNDGWTENIRTINYVVNEQPAQEIEINLDDGSAVVDALFHSSNVYYEIFAAALPFQTSIDLSSYIEGDIVFELYVLDYGGNTGEFTVNARCGSTNCRGTPGYNIGRPDTGIWQEYRVSIRSLAERGLELNTIDWPFALDFNGEDWEGLHVLIRSIRWETEAP